MLAEFRDEEPWPALQMTILGIWIFLVLKVKSRAFWFLKSFLYVKIDGILLGFFFMEEYKKGLHFYDIYMFITSVHNLSNLSKTVSNFWPSKPKRSRIILWTTSWSWDQIYSSLHSAKLSLLFEVTLLYLCGLPKGIKISLVPVNLLI